MTRIPFSWYGPRRLAAATVVAVALLTPVLAGCASSTPSASETSAALPPTAALGYWRPPADTPVVKLLCVRRVQGRYVLWLPPFAVRAPLTVEGSRLIHHIYQEDGKEISRSALWVRRDGRLVFASYRQARSGGTVQFNMLIAAVNFTKAAGSAAELAAELQGRSAEPTIQKQVERLARALGEWHGRHGRYPPRAALLPGGAFWKWKGAPHLTNAISGGPMVLGDGVGNFGYTTTGKGSFSVSGHLYGDEETTISEGSN